MQLESRGRPTISSKIGEVLEEPEKPAAQTHSRASLCLAKLLGNTQGINRDPANGMNSINEAQDTDGDTVGDMPVMAKTNG